METLEIQVMKEVPLDHGEIFISPSPTENSILKELAQLHSTSKHVFHIYIYPIHAIV